MYAVMKKVLIFLKIDLLATSMPNFKILIDSKLPVHAVQRQLLFVSSQSSNTIKLEWAELK